MSELQSLGTFMGSAFQRIDANFEALTAILNNITGNGSGSSSEENSELQIVSALGGTTIEIDYGQSVVLAVTANTTNNLLYVWSDGTESADGRCALTPTESTTISVTAYDTENSRQSNTVTFSVAVRNKLGHFTIRPRKQMVYSGDTATVTVSVDNWVADDNHILTINQYDDFGSIDKQYELTNGAAVSFPIVADHTYGVYGLVIDGEDFQWEKIEGVVEVCVRPTAADISVVGNTAGLVGGTLTITPQLSKPQDYYTYKWYRGDVLVSIADELTIANATLADAGNYTLRVCDPLGGYAEKSFTITITDGNNS